MSKELTAEIIAQAVSPPSPKKKLRKKLVDNTVDLINRLVLQKCQEQRELCAREFKTYGKEVSVHATTMNLYYTKTCHEKIKNAPSPDQL